ncbi:MAG: 3-oxoacyl-[acyl-carrier-protein] reductase [Bacteroidota bacterium]
MKLLEGKATLVTGASRGIGKEIALEFARQGAKVAFTDLHSNENTQQLETELRDLGAEVLMVEADASSLEATQTVIETVQKAFGAIDVIVNNAGITMDTLLLRMTEDQFNKVVQVNLNSVFNSTKAALRTMLKQRRGSIINISSVVGLTGNAGQANYAASKAGMIGFSKSIAKEVGSRGIRINCIAPGFIATEMTASLPEDDLKRWLEGIPLKRAGTPADVAQACVFLASDLSTYVTGQVLNVDGGMVM